MREKGIKGVEKGVYVYPGPRCIQSCKKREEKNKRIWDLREKRHKGVEKGDKAFLKDFGKSLLDKGKSDIATVQLPMEDDSGR